MQQLLWIDTCKDGCYICKWWYTGPPMKWIPLSKKTILSYSDSYMIHTLISTQCFQHGSNWLPCYTQVCSCNCCFKMEIRGRLTFNWLHAEEMTGGNDYDESKIANIRLVNCHHFTISFMVSGIICTTEMPDLTVKITSMQCLLFPEITVFHQLF